MAMRLDWQAKGFASEPSFKLSPTGGLLLYRAWGASSTEWGSGFFSLEKPTSVLDAELRFNIADWGNGIHFVSTFRLKEGFEYYVGPVAHSPRDLSRPGMQVFVPGFTQTKFDFLTSRELLRQDAVVSQQSGRA